MFKMYNRIRNNIIALALILVLRSTTAIAADATTKPSGKRDVWLMLAPGIEGAQATNLFSATIAWFTEKAEAGDRLVIFDAPRLRRLLQAEVLAGSAQRRINGPGIAQGFGKFRSFLFDASINEEEAGQLRAPQALQEVSRLRSPERTTTVVMVGSPRFISTLPAEEAWSMIEDLFPGDGLVLKPGSRSIYGTGDRTNDLAGIPVHWITPSESSWAGSSWYRESVVRLWCLFVQQQSGKLVTFNQDPATTFERLIAGETRPIKVVTPDPVKFGDGMIRRVSATAMVPVNAAAGTTVQAKPTAK